MMVVDKLQIIVVVDLCLKKVFSCLSVGQIFISTVLFEMVTVQCSEKLRFLPYYGIHHLVSPWC